MKQQPSEAKLKEYLVSWNGNLLVEKRFLRTGVVNKIIEVVNVKEFVPQPVEVFHEKLHCFGFSTKVSLSVKYCVNFLLSLLADYDRPAN